MQQHILQDGGYDFHYCAGVMGFSCEYESIFIFAEAIESTMKRYSSLMHIVEDATRFSFSLCEISSESGSEIQSKPSALMRYNNTCVELMSGSK